jgi:hypothetical protein
MRIFSLLNTQFESFVSDVQSYLSKTLSKTNTSFGSNTIFGQIITVVGNAIQNVMLYIEDALVEQNKYTAQRKKSILGLAALSGYEPSLGKAAIASIKLNYITNNTGAYNVILKNRTTLTCTQNGLKYNILLPQEAIILNVNADNAPKYFSAVQGVFHNQRFISTGGQYYTINFKYVGNLDTDYISVKVNNEAWSYAPSLYDMEPNAKQYTFKLGINGGLDVIFGNETHGRALQANDVIDVDYLIHDGTNGDLNPQVETYFVFDTELPDTSGESYDGNGLFNVTFAETDPIINGSNSESLLQTSHMIGLNSRSLVLASPDNYKVLINRFGFCGYNRTWTDANSMMVNSLIIKNFKADLTSGSDYFELSEDDFKLSDLQKASIYSYIENNGGQLAATKYNIIDPDLCKYAMYVYVTLKSTKYNKDLIAKQISQLIGDFFIDVQSDMFIPKSDIVHLLKANVEGIDSVDVYIISQKNEEAIINEKYVDERYEINNVTGQYVKRTENVKVYPGENPNIGLDSHGNIYLKNDNQFPVLMGGWICKNSDNERVEINYPLTIIFED